MSCKTRSSLNCFFSLSWRCNPNLGRWRQRGWWGTYKWDQLRPRLGRQSVHKNSVPSLSCWNTIRSSVGINSISEFTEVEAPDFINRLSLPLPSEDDHDVVDLDSRVGVKTSRSWLTSHWMPASGNWTIHVISFWKEIKFFYQNQTSSNLTSPGGRSCPQRPTWTGYEQWQCGGAWQDWGQLQVLPGRPGARSGWADGRPTALRLTLGGPGNLRTHTYSPGTRLQNVLDGPWELLRLWGLGTSPKYSPDIISMITNFTTFSYLK